METEGVATNEANASSVVAVSYGTAKTTTDDVYVQNAKDYKEPLFVDKLPLRQPINGGAPETVDEV